jgi:hypothetical protein
MVPSSHFTFPRLSASLTRYFASTWGNRGPNLLVCVSRTLLLRDPVTTRDLASACTSFPRALRPASSYFSLYPRPAPSFPSISFLPSPPFPSFCKKGIAVFAPRRISIAIIVAALLSLRRCRNDVFLPARPRCHAQRSPPCRSRRRAVRTRRSRARTGTRKPPQRHE